MVVNYQLIIDVSGIGGMAGHIITQKINSYTDAANKKRKVSFEYNERHLELIQKHLQNNKTITRLEVVSFEETDSVLVELQEKMIEEKLKELEDNEKYSKYFS